MLVISVRIRRLILGATVAMMKCWVKFSSQLMPYSMSRKPQMVLTAPRSMLPVMPCVMRSVIFCTCLGPIRDMTVPRTAQVMAVAIAGIWGLAYSSVCFHALPKLSDFSVTTPLGPPMPFFASGRLEFTPIRASRSLRMYFLEELLSDIVQFLLSQL